MSYIITRFGNLLLPLYNGKQQISTGKARITAVDAPRGGAYDTHGNERVYWGGYEITVVGALMGSDINSQYLMLRSYLGKKDKLFRKMPTNTEQWVRARLEQVNAVVSSEQYNKYLEVELVFYVYSATWHGAHHGGMRFDDGYTFDSGHTFDQVLAYTLANNITNVILINNGNSEITDIEMNIIPRGTALTEVQIEKNLETAIMWKGRVEVNTPLTFNFGSMRVTNHGVGAYSGFTYLPGHKIDDWLRLSPGENEIVIKRVGGSSESIVTFTYDDAFI